MKFSPLASAGLPLRLRRNGFAGILSCYSAPRLKSDLLRRCRARRKYLIASGSRRTFRSLSRPVAGRNPRRVKMTVAGMNYDDYPSASADDAAERESIIKLALARATRLKDEESPQAVYVGDGVWDARACRKVGIPFLGIAAGAQREKLLAAGAAQILPDFSDQSRFFAAIETILAI